jgi:UDP-galactopyranose mutase
VDFFTDDITFENGVWTKSGHSCLRNHWHELADRLVFTGKIDEFFDYRYGKLNYRTVRFEQETLDTPNWQGNAVVNYTEADIPYTRIIEHKHFEMFGQEVYDCPKMVISREYSTEWQDGMEPYYPVNDEANNSLAERYRQLGAQETDVIFGGRLAEYKYYDMAPIVEKVLLCQV